MGTQLLQLMVDVFVEVLKGIKARWSNRRGSSAVFNSCAKILFGRAHQAAVGVINDHELLGAQQIVRHEQRSEAIVRHDAAGVANDVRVPRPQAQGADGKPGVHAGEDGKLTFGTWGKVAQCVGLRVDFVRSHDFIYYAHGLDSLTKRVKPIQKGNIGMYGPPRATTKNEGDNLAGAGPREYVVNLHSRPHFQVL